MSTESATTILYVITSIAAAVWLAAFAFLRRINRVADGAVQEGSERFAPDAPTGANVVAETLEVKGDPATLSARLASVLARDGLTMIGPVKLTNVTHTHVGFETMAPTRSSVMVGQVEFRPRGGGPTEASYWVEVPRSRGLMVAAWGVQALGLAAIILGFWLVKTMVVDSPNSQIRIQAFQMVQVIHILWPPFLLGALATGQKRTIRNQIHALVSNLPYLPE